MTIAAPWIEAFAPATVSNLGPGFDCLGLALHGPGDVVRARRRASAGVEMHAITGDGGKLPLGADENTACVAVAAMLARYAPDAGIELELDKGLPLGSGLGSSGASACAALVAAEAALGLGLSPHQLIDFARRGEAVACGSPHPDNVAPCLVGGFVLITSLDPLRVVSLPVPEHLHVVVYTPNHPVRTEDARRVLPKQVPLDVVPRQAARLALLVHALHVGDLELLGEAIVDEIAEPARAGLVPGFVDAKVACLEAGAIACSYSGSGPTTFALASTRERANALLEILDDVFTHHGVRGKGHVDRVGPGARVTSTPLH